MSLPFDVPLGQPPASGWTRRCCGLLLGLAWLCYGLVPGISWAAGKEAAAETTKSIETAPVEIDGRVLFHVRGASALPAPKRAAKVSRAIADLAADEGIAPEGIQAVDRGFMTRIEAGNRLLLSLVDADAEIEGLNRDTLAHITLSRIKDAVAAYREERRPEVLLGNFARAGGLALLGVAVVFALVWVGRRAVARAEARVRAAIQVVEERSHRLLSAAQIWNGIARLVYVATVALILLTVYLCLQAVFDLFPWTRGIAGTMHEVVVEPLLTIGLDILGYLPNLVFLAIIFYLTRAALRWVKALFDGVQQGSVRFRSFDPEWASPTHRLVRIGLIAFALVMAYPYLPGSQSEAFKAMTLFVGVLFSIGSSSMVSNLVAGYSMTYRRAFRVGDRIRIGDTLGDVTDTRLMVTHLRTLKNEEVVIPNSEIINGEVVNYSARAKEEGLILHTRVGIGYETPWRQVEAMLLLAASHVPGLKPGTQPFVRQQSLGDFAVVYEINVFCDDAKAMPLLYTELHRAILDVFNEYGVQIMTPAYEGDPEQPKVVPKDQWYTAPAAQAEGGKGTPKS